MADDMNHRGEPHHEKVVVRGLSDPAALAMAAFAIPLFVWSAFNADYFDLTNERFIIPLAVFFGGPVAIATAMWAYHRKDAYLATAAGLFGSFWLTYGMLLWLTHEGVVDEASAGGDLRGLLFIPWAVSFGILWVASMPQHWTISLVAVGATAMFALLSIAYYRDSSDALQAAGWVGFVTSGVGWYAGLAELLNAQLEHPILPTDMDTLRRFRLGTRAH